MILTLITVLWNVSLIICHDVCMSMYLQVGVSTGLGVNTTAVLSNMDCPLGLCVGNALEVLESIHCLQGKGPQALRTLVSELGLCCGLESSGWGA